MSRRRSLLVTTGPAPRTRWTPELYAAVAEGERVALRPLFDRGPEGAIAAAASACERAADLDRAAVAREPPPSPIACTKGCSFCCASKIVAVAPEVIRIADHLRRTLDADALAALADRVRATHERTAGLSRADRASAGIPCPLLEDGVCSVHEVRPLLCRAWSSLDAAACERHFDDPARAPVAPVYEPAFELASAVLAGLGRAAIDAGKDGSLLELVAALRIALERPNAADRWARGLGVFSTARDAEAALTDCDPV